MVSQSLLRVRSPVHFALGSRLFFAPSFWQPFPNLFWVSISWPGIASSSTLSPGRSWTLQRSGRLAPLPPPRRAVRASPPHFAMSLPCSPLFRPSSAMAQALLGLSTASAISLKPPDALFLPKHAAWIQKNTGLRKKSSDRWKLQVLSEGQILPGHLPFTWSPNQTVLGDHAEITAG